jgi:methylated-DNA-[protein]-cysteine S-methyltransferase
MSEDGSSGIYARESTYLDRYVQLGIASGRVVSVSFPQSRADEAESEHQLLDRITDYLQGSDPEFEDVTIGLTVPTDQRAVLETAREIPYGEQLSVERLAGMTPDRNPENDEDLDLVRTALAANPVPIFVPDHRVRDGPSAAPPRVEQLLRSVEGL